jgi:hypothetical protein
MPVQGVRFGAPAPAPAHAPIAELAQAAQALLDVFVANGYALKARVPVLARVLTSPPSWPG